MPNQLAGSKRRQSLAEHAAVLAALTEIARHEGTTVMALMRRAVRDAIRGRAGAPGGAERLRAVVLRFTPKPPKRFTSPAQLARFKRTQREFDQVIMDLQLAGPATVQAGNSVVSPQCRIRVLELEHCHDLT